MTSRLLPTRRLVSFGALAATLIPLDRRAAAQTVARTTGEDEGWRVLRAAPTRLRLKPEPAEEAEVWAFDGRVPGPVLRVRHGDEARIRLVNDTPKPLALHWHGLRGASAMDGVGGLSQTPVPPGRSFDYRFTPPDAGTFLVRPLVANGGSSEPGGRGLSAALVVEEREPPAVDQDLMLFVDDWRLTDQGALSPFDTVLEAATGGRLGNLLTVEARAVPHPLDVAPGARIRLRLANVCNARSMRVRFDDLKAWVIAIDGQPTDTFEPLKSTLPFAPGTRYDLLIDAPTEAGAKGSVMGLVGQGGGPLVTIATAGEPATAKRRALPPIAGLPPNPMLPPGIRLQNALRRDAVLAGGATREPNGQLAYKGDPARIWTVNGAAGASSNPPLFTTKRGTFVVLRIVNQTPTIQPLHLHGHVFRLLHAKDDGWEPYWLDTLPVPEGKTVLIAFLADNPGRWALSSTVLERFDTGLWSWFEVT